MPLKQIDVRLTLPLRKHWGLVLDTQLEKITGLGVKVRHMLGGYPRFVNEPFYYNTERRCNPSVRTKGVSKGTRPYPVQQFPRFKIYIELLLIASLRVSHVAQQWLCTVPTSYLE
eukprot:1181343-Amphidinium_carterae.1